MIPIQTTTPANTRFNVGERVRLSTRKYEHLRRVCDVRFYGEPIAIIRGYLANRRLSLLEPLYLVELVDAWPTLADEERGIPYDVKGEDIEPVDMVDEGNEWTTADLRGFARMGLRVY